MLTRRSLLSAAASVTFAGMTGVARAANDYPSNPMRILVGYPAGGGVDIVARLLGEHMRQSYHQTVIVENRSGASAMIASNAVAKAPPDGYMLLAAASGEVAINQHIFKSMSYDPARELAPLALIGIVPCVIVVADKTPVHNPKELIAYARANPGKLSFSSSGVGNPQQLAGELMNSMAGLKVLHVPYRGSALAVTDVATGAVTMSFSSLAAALPLIKSGQLRAVAVTSKERMPQLPDVAPLREGDPSLSDYELLNWFGMFAPAKTPADVMDKLNAEINTALAEPSIKDKLLIQGIVPQPMNVAEFTKFVRSESDKFAQIAKTADIKVEN
jgi:tripartite-type tricarboxylate transporter receptor subunit TctC